VKIFLDTNIFLDLLFARAGYDEALRIIEAVESAKFEGYLLDITLLNIDYVAKKQRKEIRNFLELINSTFTICGADNEIIEQALLLNHTDFEDSVQLISAIGCGCEVLVTNDKDFPTHPLIEILDPHTFIKNNLQ
jgi:predicted nucleic acid-binding protein